MTKDRIRTAAAVPMCRVSDRRRALYLKYAKELIEKGEAYYCFCDKERLESLKNDGSRKRNRGI